ncbi:MAG: hypothetical protein NTU47_15660 [Ignavibacteriales bacterium]|nr:hypothetical protein [Ignavibacteriales bacterium]
MKNLVRLIVTLALAVVIVGTLPAIIIKDRPTAQSNGSNVVVRWTTIDETGVEGFQVLRRNGLAGEFALISGSVIAAKGNNSTYDFTDSDVFKSSSGIFQYRVRILNGQNPAPETEIVTVSHVSSASKRTWGSIKAMFR